MLSKDQEMSPCYTVDALPKLAMPITYRVFLCKKGEAQYFSHLDLQRSFMRVLTRAGIPMWYTEGFNPHPKVVFALPLSIGAESICEFIDLKIDREISCEAIKNQLNQALTDDMLVRDVYIPETKFTDMYWATYDYEIVSPSLNSDEVLERMRAILTTSPLYMTKHSKAGEKTFDIIPMIRSLSITRENGVVKMTAMLAASPTEDYLNPDFLVTAVRREMGLGDENVENESHTVLRTEVYKQDGTTRFR